MTKSLVSSEPSPVDARIYLLRGQRVMLDSDLASLYGVATKVLMQAVNRNRPRFPDDFSFVMTSIEFGNLKSQIVTSSLVGTVGTFKSSHGGRRTHPRVFTQEGVAMLSGVLRSDRAVAVNIEIMRAFVRLRQLVFSVKELGDKVAELEQKYDGQFSLVFDAIKELMAPPAADDIGIIGFSGRSRKSPAP